MADYRNDQERPQGDPGSQQEYSYNYNYRYRRYSYNSGKGSAPQGDRPPQRDDGWGEWIWIAILFFIPSGVTQVIAVIWLLRKLLSMDSRQKQRYRQEAQRAADTARSTVADLLNLGSQVLSGSERQAPPNQGAQAQTQAQQAKPRPEETAQAKFRRNGADATESRRQKAKRQARSDSAGGTGLIIGGAITSAIFGLSSAAVLMELLQYGATGDDLIGLLACMMFLAGGVAMLLSGINMNRRGERYLNYLAYIGANREVPLAHMAATFGVSVGKLCKDLRRMLAKGILPTGYLDLAEGKLYLTEMGYHAPEPKEEPQPQPQETPQQAAAREDDILREIRQVNDQIPDAVMSAKIDRIGEITGKILNYQRSHPNKEGQLRSFLNYYLPTTLKILRAYAQLDAQGIEGENISATKKRIEDMMDQVVYGFEKQLDKLFQDDAMDITSDVAVLENMLKKDGLSDADGITMTL